MRRHGTHSVSQGYLTSGLGAAIRQGWVGNPITQEDYEWLKKTVKGWTAKKFAYHGMSWPPVAGWRKKILRDYERTHGATPKERSGMDLPAWNYAPPSDAEAERLAMKKLYQEKSGDYSY